MAEGFTLRPVGQANKGFTLRPIAGGSELRSREITVGDRLFDAANAVGLPASRMRNDFQGAQAFGVGAAEGASLNFNDEAEAALRTGFGITGDFEETRQGIQGRNDFITQSNPGAATAGRLAGALGTGGTLAKGGVLASTKLASNASLPQKAAAAGLDGFGFGFVSGAGSGDDIESRARNAGIDGGLGLGFGLAIPVVGQTLRAGGRVVKNKVGNALETVFQPEQAAQRQVAQARAIDGPSRINETSAALNNQQVLNVDRGGETTRALTRSVANQNPEARGVLEKVANDRFATQGKRASDLIDRIAGGQVDDVAFQEGIETAARRANSANYEQAYKANLGVSHSLEFDALAKRIPATAMRNAQAVAKAEGRPLGEQLIASIDEAADTVTFKRAPSIREWDYIQRGLRSAAGTAFSTGKGEVGTAFSGLRKELLDTMDKANPAFEKARKGAAAFFGADDSLEAGRKFVSMPAKDMRKTVSTIRNMKPAEREAFRTGFAAELKAKISGVQDRTNVIKTIFGSAAAREKIFLALGKKNFREFKAFVETENASDMLRGALGNSTTARQLTELGIGAGLGSGAEFQQTGGISGVGALTGVAIAASFRAGGVKANENTMKKVADILLSEDPAKLAAGSKLIAKSAEMRFTLDKMQKYIQTSLIAPVATAPSQ